MAEDTAGPDFGWQTNIREYSVAEWVLCGGLDPRSQLAC